MQKQVIAFALLVVVVAAASVQASSHELHAEQNYCPRNERKSCHVKAQNREKFDFLLSCPASAPLYKMRGSYQGESQFSTTKNSAWHSSYLFTQNSDFLNNRNSRYPTGASLSPNMFGVTRADRDVFLFESSFENGIVDERQNACRSWHHQFAANKDVFLFDSGNGKPIIVAQDARWGSRRWGEGVQEIVQQQDYLAGHSGCTTWPFDCDDSDNSNAQSAHTKLVNGVWDSWHDGYKADSNYKYTGQWLYSVCADQECSSASTPRPFWGRDIGEPLHQNTLAELTYFPMAPDWAYNSPVLGATPSAVANAIGSGRGSYFARENQQNWWAVGNSPGGIASTHVTNPNGERVLVLLVSGLPLSNGGRPASEWAGRDDSPNEGVQPAGAYYLVWCQDPSCTTWGIRSVPSSGWTYGNFHDDVTLEWANLRGSLATSEDDDGNEYLHVMLHRRDYRRAFMTHRLRMWSLDAEDWGDSIVDASDRERLFAEIYEEMVGIPLGHSGPSSSESWVDVDGDFEKRNYPSNGVFPNQRPESNDYTTAGPLHAFSGAGENGQAWTEANHPLLAGPLRSGYGFSNQPLGYQQLISPSKMCSGLEQYGVKSDPWCHWHSYFVVVDDDNGDEIIVQGEAELLDMGYDIVVPCEGTPYYFTARRGPAQHDSPNDYAAVMWSDGNDEWYWPEPVEDPEGDLSAQAGVNQSPYQMADIVLGRTFSAVRSANGQPFFTWADLGAGLGDGAVQTWGVCGFTDSPSRVAPTCHTLLDSIELGTMGWLNGMAGKTLLLSAPDDELPVMVYYFDHFGGSASYVEHGVDGFPAYSNSVRSPANGMSNANIRTGRRNLGPSSPVFREESVPGLFSDYSSRLRIPAPGQVTNRPLVVACLDALCEEASVSAFAPARMADIVNWWQGPYATGLDMRAKTTPNDNAQDYTTSCLDWMGRVRACDGGDSEELPSLPGANGHVLLDSFVPGSVDALNVAEYPLFSLRQVNPSIRADARFVGKQLYVVLNEGGYDDEFANNPVKVWRTNRWASPTGMPCSGGNAGERVVADDVVYICTRVRIGSPNARLYAGQSPRPWSRLYEWVKMDWGYGLRNLGGFLGWGSDEQRLLDIVSDKNPFFTHGVVDWLQHATHAQTDIREPYQPNDAPSSALMPQILHNNDQYWSELSSYFDQDVAQPGLPFDSESSS